MLATGAFIKDISTRWPYTKTIRNQNKVKYGHSHQEPGVMPCRLFEAQENASDLQITTAFLVLYHIDGWKGDGSFLSQS